MSHSRAGFCATGIVAVAVLLVSCANGVAGSAAPSGIPLPATSAPVASPSSSPSTSTAASSPAASESESSPAASSSAVSSGTATSRPGAVPGVPHSTPLAANILLSTRKVDDSEDLYQIDTTTGMVGTRLTNGSGGAQIPIISPDRGTVLYQQYGENGGLRVMAADGTGDRPLFTSAADFCHSPRRPAWNPLDTSEIAVSCVTEDGVNQLQLIGIDGTLRSTLNTGLTTFDDPTYSPDGKTLAFWGSLEEGAGGGALYVQPANGGGSPRQITNPGKSNDVDPVWSVDGKTIYFRRATPTEGGDVGQILSVGAEGGAVTAVSDGTAFDQDPTVAPDGKQIAFKSNRINAAGTSDPQVWVLNVDGTGLRQVGLGSLGSASGAPEWGRR